LAGGLGDGGAWGVCATRGRRLVLRRPETVAAAVLAVHSPKDLTWTVQRPKRKEQPIFSTLPAIGDRTYFSQVCSPAIETGAFDKRRIFGTSPTFVAASSNLPGKRPQVGKLAATEEGRPTNAGAIA